MGTRTYEIVGTAAESWVSSSWTLQFSDSSDFVILRGGRLLKRRFTEFDLSMRTDFHHIFYIFIKTMSASSDRFFAM